MDFEQDDPVIARIREVRHRISEECGHDPYKLVAHYMEIQKQHKERLLPPPGNPLLGTPDSEEAELVEA